MNTLKNHLILFDAECPMCQLYTKAFVNTGMLEKEGRLPYQDFPAARCPVLDHQRAVNEIALIDLETGNVSYGIHSFFKIFSVSLPFLKPLFAFRPFIGVMEKAYAFISYNRRVIIPAAEQRSSTQQMPAFRLDYRIAYLVFSWLVIAYILSGYTRLMNGLIPDDHIYREYLICGGQLLFQALVVSRMQLGNQQKWDYLGHMMTISFGGALLLLPVLLISQWISLPAMVYAGYFMGVAGLMFLEHIRRTRLLKLGWGLTVSWALYRFIVLLIILLV
ncbi:hypothetical protein TH53_18440 [Pedobacter lusitanus]|uniref:DUF393 domain-containing protein n=1 Tax=Pedobacter lusitanus TaxID=1503925 RepID=A0A0D0FTY3_9SPHI|nr:hypothetical protein [Pedobacter lusitanus]KIO75864.1 hypothetical protein TH53_18440 [Pedobacter lusitanus]